MRQCCSLNSAEARPPACRLKDTCQDYSDRFEAGARELREEPQSLLPLHLNRASAHRLEAQTSINMKRWICIHNKHVHTHIYKYTYIYM